jgi:bifunctional enzyme CysN/CysC
MPAEILRIAIAGSADNGKSTLLERLVFDARQVPDDQRRRKLIVADTLEHERYTRDMVTAGSTANLAIILIDARHGVVEQSRRHAFLASLLGISHVVVCVNKMDLVGFDRSAFRRIEDAFQGFAAKLDVKDVTFIPVSALHGDNVLERSPNIPWYEGPPLLYHLEHVHIASDRNLIDCRFPVQWIVRPTDEAHHDYRGHAGRMASGVLRKGDDVVILPTMARSRVARIDTFDGEVEQAFPPMSVTVLLEHDLDISRGDMICRPNNLPSMAQEFDAIVCWMDEKPLEPGNSYVLRQTTRSVRAHAQQMRYRIDVNTLSRDATASLAMDEIGRVQIRTSSPLYFDEYRKNRETGSFILVDETTNATAGAGMLLEAYVASRDRIPPRASTPPSLPPAGPTASPNVVRHQGALTREMRAIALHTRGATVWLTGLSGAGKSTIGAALEHRLVLLGCPAYLLDGDNLRHGLCGDLGFSSRDRAENVRRTSHVASILSDAGIVAIVTLISPFAVDRANARKLMADVGTPFIETYVATPLQECERRDPKGLYKRARAGQIRDFTGIDAPYEPPMDPEVVISELGVDDAVDLVIEALRAQHVFA